jgi:hypothetical protein
MKTYKGNDCNQYYQRNLSVCVMTAEWRKTNNMPEKSAPMFFVGVACGNVSRKFAADIIRQFRKDQARERGGK